MVTLIFEPLYLLKSCPIFNKTAKLFKAFKNPPLKYFVKWNIFARFGRDYLQKYFIILIEIKDLGKLIRKKNAIEMPTHHMHMADMGYCTKHPFKHQVGQCFISLLSISLQ